MIRVSEVVQVMFRETRSSPVWAKASRAGVCNVFNFVVLVVVSFRVRPCPSLGWKSQIFSDRIQLFDIVGYVFLW